MWSCQRYLNAERHSVIQLLVAIGLAFEVVCQLLLLAMIIAVACKIQLNFAAFASCAAASGIVVAVMAFAIGKTRAFYISSLASQDRAPATVPDPRPAPQDLGIATVSDDAGAKAKRLSKAIAPRPVVRAFLLTGRQFREETPPASA